MYVSNLSNCSIHGCLGYVFSFDTVARNQMETLAKQNDSPNLPLDAGIVTLLEPVICWLRDCVFVCQFFGWFVCMLPD